MDNFNARFNMITMQVENMKRCVDDSLLYSKTLEGVFYQTTQYLSLMGRNGILQNPEMLQFGKMEVEWACFLITDKSVKPLPKHMAAIRTFPTPMGITDMRSFMALLQRVAYSYAISSKVTKLRPFETCRVLDLGQRNKQAWAVLCQAQGKLRLVVL